ncbi:SRPBCC family protein [Actinoplanes sp. NPDC026619]|uniref:SRPBCC family protein n=1 Tax=Actinoplanes sp. NPDC026619 TaxID=3155798 RepID=UPI003411210E
MTPAAWKAMGGAALAAAVVAASPARRRHLTLGATADENSRALPGDELIAAPAMVSTRAVTITAALSSVWPWLVEMAGPAAPGMRVERCDPGQTLVLRSAAGDRVWSLHLSTYWLNARLISRTRVAPGGLRRLAQEPVRLATERRTLLGIKERAERNALM